MKKATMKAVQSLYTSRKERCFACYDKQENVIIVGNGYAAIVFDNISESDREVLENLSGFGEADVSVARFLDNFKNHYNEYYDDNKCCKFNIRDLQQEVKKTKAGKRGKSYSGNSKNVDEFLFTDFGITYNIELLADAAACLEEYDEYKSCNAAFPKDRRCPIILGGKYGYAIVMPALQRSGTMKHSNTFGCV